MSFKSNTATDFEKQSLLRDDTTSSCNPQQVAKSLKLFIALLITFFSSFLLAFMFKGDIVYALTALEDLSTKNELLFNLILISVFVLVSLPFVWGYTLAIIVCAYMHSFIYAFFLVVIYSLVGITVSFFLCRQFKLDSMFVSIKLNSRKRYYLQTLSHLIENNQDGFKIIFLSRLIPLPFGITNLLFAITQVNFFTYMLASILGLMPSQIVFCYIGTTLKSMSDLISYSKTAKTAKIIFIVQFLFVFVFMYYLFKLAKIEFEKQINANNSKLVAGCENKSSTSELEKSDQVNII